MTADTIDIARLRADIHRYGDEVLMAHTVLSMLDELEKARAELERARAGARWYCVNRIGIATLGVDEADARESATEYDAMWPGAAPHRAVLLGDVGAIDQARAVQETQG